jgi:hypothetical protein
MKTAAAADALSLIPARATTPRATRNKTVSKVVEIGKEWNSALR